MSKQHERPSLLAGQGSAPAPVDTVAGPQDREGNQAVASQVAPAPDGGGETSGLGATLGAVAGGLLGGVTGGALGATTGAVLGGMAGNAIEGALTGESNVESGLGDAADELASRSPTLRSTLETLQADGWTVVWGTAGGGSFADRSAKTITVDPNGQGDAAGLVQTLAHEAGHASYDIDGEDPYVEFGSLTRDEYVDQNTMRCLRDEAEATITNLTVRDELNTGPEAEDIGVAGAGSATYIQEWERYKADEITRSELVERIANAFATGEVPSTGGAANYYEYYAQTYRDHWDANHPAAGSGTP